MDYYPLARCANASECPWLNARDVVIDACIKCGTNWMLTVVHELRTWNEPELQDFENIGEVSPWVELVQFPGVNIVVVISFILK